MPSRVHAEVAAQGLLAAPCAVTGPTFPPGIDMPLGDALRDTPYLLRLARLHPGN